MRKFFLSAVALVGLFTSCSNDDIDVEVTELGDNVVLNISTQSVYDDFGVAQSLKERMLSQDQYSMGIYSFIYGENGELVASDSVTSKTFGQIQMEFPKLKAGNYDVVTLEMLVDNTRHNQSPNWVIVGQDKLSTLEIVNKNYDAYWYSAVGLGTQEIDVRTGENLTSDITPKGIGCVIDTRMTNFNLSPYCKATLFTKDQPKGRLISPYISGEDRFVYDKYNESNTWTGRGFAFSSEGLESLEAPTIYLIEEGTLRYCFGAQLPNGNGGCEGTFYAVPNDYSTFPVSDGHRYYGGFAYLGGKEGQDCDASMFNTYNQYERWYDSLTPNYNTGDATDPYLVWGASATEVDEYMTKQGMSSSDYGTTDEMYWINYSNRNGTLLYQYQFNPNRQNLNCVFMDYLKTAFSLDEVLAELSNKYEALGYDNDLKGYLFYSDTTVLLATNQEDSIQVLFIPNSSNNTSISPITKDVDIRCRFKKLKL